jgi:hypothetical protein
MSTTAPSESAAPATAIERGPTRAPFDACPSCDGGVFDTEVTIDRPIFRCAGCGAGWMFELGYVRPTTRPG